jgi:hypothetical protein
VKLVVLSSINDASQQRYVDVLRDGDGQFSYRECGHDPEDNSGWRHLSATDGAGFPTLERAQAAADRSIGWFGSGGRT